MICKGQSFYFHQQLDRQSHIWKGTSKLRALFELVLRLKALELDHDLQLHVVHMSGKRIIAEGADGLSRADHELGMMMGKDIRFSSLCT
jgi:hypothetical protein